MPRKSIAKYFAPWMFQRDKKRLRFDQVRERDGDNCWRCKRPMRFDLPPGHDLAPTIEHLLPKSKGGTSALDNLCLCHGRCNRLMADATPEVKERMRRKSEAELFAKSRSGKSKAA
jgi:5-methylcytosine-specific restriction endonuclease McrA